MEPTFQALTIYKGSRYTFRLTWINPPPEEDPTDLTGMHFRMQIRADRTEDAELLYTLDSETNEGGVIAFDPIAGIIEGEFPVTDTQAITYQDAVYDLFFKDSYGNPEPLMFGTVHVIQNSTRF